KSLSVRATEHLIRDLHSSKKSKSTAPAEMDPEIHRIQERLSETLGATAQVTSRDGMKGEIKIKFESTNHREEILDVLESERLLPTISSVLKMSITPKNRSISCFPCI